MISGRPPIAIRTGQLAYLTLTFDFFKLKIGTTVKFNTTSENVETSFDFPVSFCFQVSSSCATNEQTDIQTDGRTDEQNP